MSLVQGKASRKAVSAAIRAHLRVLRGEGFKAALNQAFQEVPGLGGQERRFSAFAGRELSRHMRRLDAMAKALRHPPSSFSLLEDQAIVRYALWRKFEAHVDEKKILSEIGLPGPVRPRSVRDELLRHLLQAQPGEFSFQTELERLAFQYSWTSFLAQKLSDTVPPEQLEALFRALNTEQPVIFRVRPQHRIADVVEQLAALGTKVRPLPVLEDALALEEDNRSIFDSNLFRQGHLQVMDFGSQLIVQLCQPPAGFVGARIADVCAGAGGKTLALADKVGTKGRVWATDLSSHRLAEARRRVQEARLGNVEFTKDIPFEQIDVALVDAPCSGIGTVAREPDVKWKITPQGLEEFQRKQLDLLSKTATRLKPGATLVYATCSLLRAENEDVVSQFLLRHPDFIKSSCETLFPEPYVAEGCLRAFPHIVPGAGFFAARFYKGVG